MVWFVVMDTLLPWQQKHVLIALLFEVVGTSYLVQRSIEATAICGMICCYGHLVTMATEACAYSFTVWSCRSFIQWSLVMPQIAVASQDFCIKYKIPAPTVLSLSNFSAFWFSCVPMLFKNKLNTQYCFNAKKFFGNKSDSTCMNNVMGGRAV